MSANFAVACSATGFFSARAVMPWLQPGGALGATSFYDTSDLKHTLERLVDFDHLNAGMTRFSAGAVNVRTGNFVYFDTGTHKIAPEHVRASGTATGLSSGRNRWRALLGWRPRVQHAAAMGNRE
jgi:NTE family protein